MRSIVYTQSQPVLKMIHYTDDKNDIQKGQLLSQVCTAGKWQSQDSNPNTADP